MHCWRAVPAFSRPSASLACSSSYSCVSRALERGKVGVLLGHQCGELFAAERGIVSWHGFFYLAALFVR
jgi:hypothetical protein